MAFQSALNTCSQNRDKQKTNVYKYLTPVLSCDLKIHKKAGHLFN